MPTPNPSGNRRSGSSRVFVGNRAEAWRRRLIEALALVEAGIDFSDEADVARRRHQPLLGGRACAAAGNCCGPGRGSAGVSGCGKGWSWPSPDRRMPEIDPSEPDRPPGRGDRVAACRNHAGRDRGPSRSGGVSVTLAGYGGIREAIDPVEQEGWPVPGPGRLRPIWFYG